MRACVCVCLWEGRGAHLLLLGTGTRREGGACVRACVCVFLGGNGEHPLGLARGKHPYSAHFRLTRSPHPVGHRVSGTSPKAGLASGKFPTRQRCLPCGPTGCLFLNTQLGCLFLNTQLGWVSPLEYEASPPLSGLCQIYWVACRNRPTNHLISNLDP